MAKKIKLVKDTEFHSLVWSYVKNRVDEIIAALQFNKRMDYYSENYITHILENYGGEYTKTLIASHWIAKKY